MHHRTFIDTDKNYNNNYQISSIGAYKLKCLKTGKSVKCEMFVKCFCVSTE